jgi:hypothetical protein
MDRNEAWVEVLDLERELAKLTAEVSRKKRRLRALMHYIKQENYDRTGS